MFKNETDKTRFAATAHKLLQTKDIRFTHDTDRDAQLQYEISLAAFDFLLPLVKTKAKTERGQQEAVHRAFQLVVCEGINLLREEHQSEEERPRS